jgi:Putative DNA-binding domain
MLAVTPQIAPAGLQDRFAAALLDPTLAPPPELRAWNGSDPVKRFAVYRNNVVSGLIDVLADTFSVTQTLVGDEFFRAMASLYVRNDPPRSRVLALYGKRLPDFIDEFEPAQSVPYLGDVARLEFARVRACHAADATPLDAAALSGALAGRSASEHAKLALHPSVSVLTSKFGVVSIWAAHQVDDVVDLSQVSVWEPEQALVVRKDLDVLVVPLGAGAARFTAALLGGADYGDAARAGLQIDPALDLAVVVGTLFRHGAIIGVRISGDQK